MAIARSGQEPTAARGGKARVFARGAVLGLDTVAAFNISRPAAARMNVNEPEDGERGVIINTSSIAAFESRSGRSPAPRPKPPSPGCA